MDPVICSSRFDKSVRDEFKRVKMELRHKVYPEAETVDFVCKYYNYSVNVFKKLIPPNALLLNVPSGSLVNPIPEMFANLVQQGIPGTKFYNSSRCFTPMHKVSAKDTLNFKARTTFPISFGFIGDKHNIEELKNLAKARPVIIMEDWASTGESAVNFGKTLSIHGVAPRNIACLITNSKYFASDRELNQLVSILQKHTSVPKDKLNYLVYGNFHDYLGQKISRFTFELGRIGKKEQFIPFLEKSVDNYKQLGYTSDQRIFKNIHDGLSVARDPSLGI